MKARRMSLLTGAGPLANHNSRKPIEETVTYL